MEVRGVNCRADIIVAPPLWFWRHFFGGAAQKVRST
jgi:hypothetical protein